MKNVTPSLVLWMTACLATLPACGSTPSKDPGDSPSAHDPAPAPGPTAPTGATGVDATPPTVPVTVATTANPDAILPNNTATDPTPCGGLTVYRCPEGQFCDYGAHCGATDQTGVCAKRPEACIRMYAPVCGCDGRTYGNRCDAHAGGISVHAEGPCPGDPRKGPPPPG